MISFKNALVTGPEPPDQLNRRGLNLTNPLQRGAGRVSTCWTAGEQVGAVQDVGPGASPDPGRCAMETEEVDSAPQPVFETTVPTNAYQAIPLEMDAISASIMPVLGWWDGSARWLGTCFAVSTDGILLTARHVVDGFLRSRANDIAAGRAGILVVAETDVRLGDDDEGVPEFLGSVLNVVSTICHPHTDIALLRVAVSSSTTGALLQPLVVDVSPPSVGDQCLAIGYKHCSLHGSISPDGLNPVDYERQLVISRGTVDEVFLEQHGEREWDYPCVVTSAKYNGGMSGSPVILPDGRIHGLVSSSNFPDDSSVAVGATSHVTLLAGALAFHVDGRNDASDLLAHALGHLAGENLGLETVEVHETMIEPPVSFDDLLFNRVDSAPHAQLRLRYRED